MGEIKEGDKQKEKGASNWLWTCQPPINSDKKFKKAVSIRSRG
jgi:hypothetical protein|tara:strand:+ start:249 stop:377 length:129 start_codon:yes stop_codon:yes gene_type:complete